MRSSFSQTIFNRPLWLYVSDPVKLRFIVFGSLLTFLAVWFGVNIHSFGRLIELYARQRFNLGLDYAMGVIWWIILAGVIMMFAPEPRRMLLVAWTAKFVVVLILMLFFEQRYGLDGYHYFQLKLTGSHWMYEGYDWRNDSMIPSLRPTAQLGGSVVGPGIGTENSLRFALILATVMGTYYHAMKVGCAFIGLMAIWLFYRAATIALGRPAPGLFYLLAFFPSVIFWSSILGKDPLQLFFLSLYAYGGASWLAKGRLSGFWYISLGLFGSYLLRPWVALLASGALALGTLLGRCRIWQIVLLLTVFIPAGVVGGGELRHHLSFETLSVELFSTYLQTFAEGFRAESGRKGVAEVPEGSGADLPDLTGESPGGAVPLILFSGLFRPLPFDITNFSTAIAAMENSVVLSLAVVALFRMRFVYLREPLLIWTGLYILTWALLYGLIVLANFGAGARYKLQVWPFMILVLVTLCWREGRKWLDSRARGEKSMPSP